MKYFIKTFGCQQNIADSERLESLLTAQGMKKALSYEKADYIVINTCMVRESAENRIYGLVNNLSELKNKNLKLKIILTGCLVGLACRDKTGKYLERLKEIMPAVDEFLPIEEIGFNYSPTRKDKISAWVSISNGCNNFCTYCVVPFTRGREVSRPFEDIINECKQLKKKDYKNITLLGQNVNSYGADLILNKKIKAGGASEESLREADFRNDRKSLAEEKDHERQNLPLMKPIYVKHLGRYRVPTFFPYLLEAVAKLGFERIDFISSNPWDFSDELIKVITRNSNIVRIIHLPVQSGDSSVLKRMNRWYTSSQYLRLISKIKKSIPDVKFTTDIIVGFPGETEKEFLNTVRLCNKVDFEKAYISMYSSRPFTTATKQLIDNIPYKKKKRRWKILEDLINQPKFKKKNLSPTVNDRKHQPADSNG